MQDYFNNNRFEKIRHKIEHIVGPENVFTSIADIMLYSYDAGMSRGKPSAVVRFTQTSQVAPVVKILYESKIPFVPRAAGTNLSGGTICLKSAVVLNLSLLNKIHQIDTINNIAVVEPGVVNLALQNELSKFGYFYAPDPASQKVSTIGGNIAENAGGPQCLKYGVTSNNVLKLEIVTPEGEIIEPSIFDEGPDLTGLFVGSEGTLGIVTKAWLKIIPKPKIVKTIVTAFPNIESSINAVTEIIASGIVPRALESMDKISIDAAKTNFHLDYPQATESILIVELDGNTQEEINSEIKIIENILKENSCIYFEQACNEEEREKIWQIRKSAYPAMARLAPNVLVEDGVVPRPKLLCALKEVQEIFSKYKLKAGFLFHAGDGNMHPNIIFDERDLEETKRVKKAGYEILKSYIKLGGSISGEHGVGVEKRFAMNWLYDGTTLNIFKNIKQAFDPNNISNPDKIIPVAFNRHSKAITPRKEFSENINKLIEEVKFRYKTNLPSIIIANGTKIEHDISNQQLQILNLRDLNRIIELDKHNFTIEVECGIPIKELKQQLLLENMHIDIPDLEGTIGGLIATKSFPYVRDIVLGITLLLPDGSLCSFGGKVVKNVAGYDVCKLICGSWGCFGIILTATLKVSAKVFKQDKIFTSPRRNVGEDVFKPNKYHKMLKKVFDEKNLFNPWIIKTEAKKTEDWRTGGLEDLRTGGLED